MFLALGKAGPNIEEYLAVLSVAEIFVSISAIAGSSCLAAAILGALLGVGS